MVLVVSNSSAFFFLIFYLFNSNTSAIVCVCVFFCVFSLLAPYCSVQSVVVLQPDSCGFDFSLFVLHIDVLPDKALNPKEPVDLPISVWLCALVSVIRNVLLLTKTPWLVSMIKLRSIKILQSFTKYCQNKKKIYLSSVNFSSVKVFFYIKLGIRNSDNYIYQNHNSNGVCSAWTDYFSCKCYCIYRLTIFGPILPDYKMICYVFDCFAVKKIP